MEGRTADCKVDIGDEEDPPRWLCVKRKYGRYVAMTKGIRAFLVYFDGTACVVAEHRQAGVDTGHPEMVRKFLRLGVPPLPCLIPIETMKVDVDVAQDAIVEIHNPDCRLILVLGLLAPAAAPGRWVFAFPFTNCTYAAPSNARTTFMARCSVKLASQL